MLQSLMYANQPASDEALSYDHISSANTNACEPLILPTISPTFFYKSDHPSLSKYTLRKLGSASEASDYQNSYIFFDPALNLEPYLVQAEDFITRPPTPLPPAKSQPIRQDINNMTKPQLLLDDAGAKTLSSIGSVKDKCTLQAQDFKRFQEMTKNFVTENETECKKIPRLWKHDHWKGLAIRFVDNGLGAELWSNRRNGFTSSDDFIYPLDKLPIAFLAFALLKLESEKQYRVSKATRKRKASVVSDDSPERTAVKKAKKSKPVAEDESDDDITEEAESDATERRATAKGKKLTAKATPKSASQGRITPVARSITKPMQPASTKPVPEPAAAEESSDTDEDEKTGETVAGHSIVKDDVFGSARLFSKTDAFSREALVQKPGVSFGSALGYKPPNVGIPSQTISNANFSFWNIEPAPRSMVIGDSTEPGYRNQSELPDGTGDWTQSGLIAAYDDEGADDSGVASPSKVDDQDSVTHGLPGPGDVAELHSVAQVNSMASAVAPSLGYGPVDNDTGLGAGSVSDGKLNPMSLMPANLGSDTANSGGTHTPEEASLFVSSPPATKDQTITFSITIASSDTSQVVTLSALTTFVNMLANIREAYADDDASLQSLAAAKSCIVTLPGPKPARRAVSLANGGVEASWKAVMKKVLASGVNLEEEEVEVEFK